MSEKINQVNKLSMDAKKEVERLEDKRQEDLGNSINYVENEIQIQRLYAQIDAYTQVLDVLNQ
ncbi:hypothetical protein QQG09_01750 [Melissococcus plutonius]|uniref:Uncharacterized protein n=2 Tax=Melissococcus plutonius TaxID=33970 RepID=F3YAH3_MELPT|nr:hypothetical protein [Melissococcus plutonius]BAL62138.1 hypothetical protein MPD5_0902 [Melissococcus plutonius DAT561]AIM24971.1 hypothetical protein MEPL_c009360 [Melissococcus plutonius S1]KMT25127.1 hypothetical protein MEPL2_2c06830 [Melissococcus plutonius]KMT26764.1 hypothetical protein MEPL3_2c04460 [Melissococcus plutonius]KMT28014.1 hypothetical protein MEPL1_3c06760 [Melissococcus plutonius]